MDQPGATGAGPPAAAHVNVYDEIAGNRWRTWLLVGLFVAIVALLGYVLGEVWFGGNGGVFVLPFALAIASISGLTSYFAGDKIVLGMSQAHEVSEQQEPQLHHIALVLTILTPIIAQLIQLAVSRQREYMADASGALLTRYPAGLANALRKIAADKEALEVANKATAPLYIANPLHDQPRFLDGLFDTHPPIQERIKRLEAM